jgi:energy-coupling factor transporter ATP-binding protein EcfA2
MSETPEAASDRCGKSTLLRLAGGLLQPDAGSVATAQPAGFVFQNPDHQVVLPTAGADVAFGLGRCGLHVRGCAACLASWASSWPDQHTAAGLD